MPPGCPALPWDTLHWPVSYSSSGLDTQSSLPTCRLSTETSWHGQIPVSLTYSGETGNVCRDTQEFSSPEYPSGCFQQEFCWFLCTHSQRGGGWRNLVRVPSLWLGEPNAPAGVRYSLSRRLHVAAAKSFNFPAHLLNVYLLLQTGLCGLI